MLSRRIAAGCSLLLAVTVLAPAAAAAASTDADAGSPVVVRFDPGATPDERAADLAARGLTLVDETPGSDHALAVPSGGVRAAAVAGDSSIEEVAPLVTYRAAAAAPDDPAYKYQWHLPAIGATAAWDVTTGEGTVVAVIDTGVAYEDHDGLLQAPDLAGTSFAPGWDFIDGDEHANDENGHGTHVASTIAATTGNGLGVAGAAPGVTIMPLKVLDGDGSGTDWTTAQALRFAADHGADVVNMSLGADSPSSVMADAVDYARSRGVTIVASAGNESSGTVGYPAAFEGVISVGAVRRDLTLAGYSNWGEELDLVAPGGDVHRDQDGDGYPDGILAETFDDSPSDFCFCFMQGTSMAAPQVSAAAALVASRGADDPALIGDILTATAHDLGDDGWDERFGYGLVRADAAVRAPLPGQEPLEPAVTTGSVRGIENACPSDSTPPASFDDLAGSVHRAAVSCVAWWEVASGRSADRFDPSGQVTRAQLATFVARLLEAAGLDLPASAPDAFGDDDGSVHERAIDQLAALGVVSGRGGTSYGPGGVVTRAQMATFLARAYELVAGRPLPAGADAFGDDDGSVHEANIDKVAAAGLAAGTGGDRFAPSAPVQRAQMATFLARTLDLLVATGTTAARA